MTRSDMNSKILHFCGGISLLISGCSGSGIGSKVENSFKYLGCYKYNDVPLIIIKSGYVENINQKKYNKVRDILHIKNSDFLLTANQMIFDNEGHLSFTDLNSGFQYEFERNAPIPTLLLYDKSGKEFKLVRSSDSCSSR